MSTEKTKYLLLIEVKRKKEKLRNDIDKLIFDFEADTNTTIENLQINRSQYSSKHTISDKEFFNGVSFDVNI